MVFLHEEGIDRKESEQSSKSYLSLYIYTYVNGQGNKEEEEEANHHRLVIVVVLTMFVC